MIVQLGKWFRHWPELLITDLKFELCTQCQINVTSSNISSLGNTIKPFGSPLPLPAFKLKISADFELIQNVKNKTVPMSGL